MHRPNVLAPRSRRQSHIQTLYGIDRHLLLVMLLTSALLLGSCRPAQQPPRRAFGYADLRALDPVDAPASSLDILAFYLQISSSELRIRLDMLDLEVEPETDLYLAIDTRPGGSIHLPLDAEADIEWDLLVVFPAEGDPQALDERLQPVPGAGLSMLRDPIFDTLEIRLNTALLRQQSSGPLSSLRVQAFTTHPGEIHAVDRIASVSANERPPRQGKAVLAFWNTLPAYTPGQALRRWNGAHTGPLGGRHGLENLLWAVEETGVPVILLDLLHPASVPALAPLEGHERLRTPAVLGLIGLPVVLSGAPDLGGSGDVYQWALERAREDSLQAARILHLQSGSLGFAPQGDPGQVSSQKVFFVPQPSTPALSLVQPQRQGNHLVIPVPGYPFQSPASHPDLSVGMQGPSLDMRAALVQLAQQSQSPVSAPPVLLLGGDLPGSDWGSPRVAEINLRYLQARPWIQILSPAGLLTLEGDRQPRTAEATIPPEPGAAPLGAASLPAANGTVLLSLLNELRYAPKNVLSDAAWQTYLAYYAPVWPGSPDLSALRRLYLDDAASLLAAARWAENPQPQASCADNSNGNGGPSCILASSTLFALFDPTRAGLSLMAARLPGGEIHQVIGPTSQFISGASDPYGWDLALGSGADPAVIPGAFFQKLESESPGQGGVGLMDPALLANSGSIEFTLSSNDLSFTSPAGGWSKTFTLLEDGLRVEYIGAGPFDAQIPLVLDPWSRFSSDWTQRYLRNAAPQAWAWGVKSENGKTFWVSVTASVPVSTSTFLDSSGYLVIPEDPNFDYPAGHLLPFPLALVEVSSVNAFVTDIKLEESFSWPAIPLPGQ